MWTPRSETAANRGPLGAQATACTRAFIGAGDGAIVFPLRERLPGEVSSVRHVRIECFFNNPERKA